MNGMDPYKHLKSVEINSDRVNLGMLNLLCTNALKLFGPFYVNTNKIQYVIES